MDSKILKNVIASIELDIWKAGTYLQSNTVHIATAGYHVRQAFEKLLQLILYKDNYPISALQKCDLLHLISLTEQAGFHIPDYLHNSGSTIVLWKNVYSNASNEFDIKQEDVERAYKEVVAYYNDIVIEADFKKQI